MYSGQYVFCGKNASLSTGNVLPINKIPEGTLVCNLESSYANKGKNYNYFLNKRKSF
jgi:large subunit ribosomal protein L8e